MSSWEPDEMTPEDRRAETARILAKGLQRLTELPKPGAQAAGPRHLASAPPPACPPIRKEMVDGNLKLTFRVHIERGRSKRLVEGEAPASPAAEPQGRIPRVARLLALARRLQRMLDRGKVKNRAEIARLRHVTRARVTQIMNLLLLAPDIQEEILSLPPVTRGRDPISEQDLRLVLRSVSFPEQRRVWRRLRRDQR